VCHSLPVRDLIDMLQVLESRPEAAGATGMVERSSAMHRAAAGGHLDVMRTIVESLRSYGTSITDPSKGDHKVLQCFNSYLEQHCQQLVPIRTSCNPVISQSVMWSDSPVKIDACPGYKRRRRRM
jgi:hypothetical protein